MNLLVVVAAGSYFVPAEWAGRLVPGDSVVDEGAVAFLPGTALATSSRVEADGIDAFDPDGEILLLTVAIDNDLTVLDWVRSSMDDEVDLRSRKSVYGDRSNVEQREHNRALMDSSKDIATIVALQHLGVRAADFTGVLFIETVAGGPADGLLESTDVILSIDGQPVTTVASLRAVLADLEPGTTAVVTVENYETREQRDVEITLGAHPDSGGPFIGVSGVTERVKRNPLPFEVNISLGSIGGPSAGLAFTLVVLDVLTPGELTGGKRVAVTGSIHLDGSVGDVGGVAQKAVTARDAGVEMIIVPEASVDEARSGAGDVPVVGVASLDDALQALAGSGGDPVGRLLN
ncbi:MAG: PDZ domain-containing protein [Acidimicrobiaceae bacterium]|nr:PDZ domain-containing protein [Acidimicrobiaceae bacterium]